MAATNPDERCSTEIGIDVFTDDKAFQAWRGQTTLRLTLAEIPSWASVQPFSVPLADNEKVEGLPRAMQKGVEEAASVELSSKLQVEHDCEFVCAYCCRPELSPSGEPMHCGYDHLIPRAAWPTGSSPDTRGNLVLACSKCNELKQDWVPLRRDALKDCTRVEYIAAARMYVDLKRMMQFVAWRNRVAGHIFKGATDEWSRSLLPHYEVSAGFVVKYVTDCGPGSSAAGGKVVT